MMLLATAPCLLLAAVSCVALSSPAAAQGDDRPRFTRIIHVEDSTSERTPSVTAAPQYPELARRDRIEGEATVCYTIDKNGRIHKPAVRKSSHRMFAKPALKAIKQSSYEPLRPDKKASYVKTCRTFRFLLNPVAIEDIE